MKEFVVYTAARLGLFLAVYAVVLALTWVTPGSVHPVWPLLAAAALSAVASAFVLRDLRERFMLRVNERAGRMSERVEATRAGEEV